MRNLTAPEFLAVWERGLDRFPFERALALLEAACPDVSLDQLAALSIGRRDQMLLSLREAAFGSRLTALATCPKCNETLEIEMDLDELRRVPGALHPSGGRAQQEDPPDGPVVPCVTISVADREFLLRAPNTADLAAAAGMNSEDASQHILCRCLRASDADSGVSAEELSSAVVSQAAEAIAQLDPHADIQIDVACASCGNAWLEPFDIVSFLWDELDGWARRMLREVHGLARVYGWTESEILALSPMRRHYYLEMAGA